MKMNADTPANFSISGKCFLLNNTFKIMIVMVRIIKLFH